MKPVQIEYPDFIKERFGETQLEEIEDWAGRVYEKLFDAILSEKEMNMNALELSIAATLADELAIYLDEQLTRGFKQYVERNGKPIRCSINAVKLKFEIHQFER